MNSSNAKPDLKKCCQDCTMFQKSGTATSSCSYQLLYSYCIIAFKIH